MAISERINPDTLNIHQFQETPEGRLKLPFDVERDIDSSKRDILFNELKDSLKTVGIDLYILLAGRFKFLWPNIEIPKAPEEEIENRRQELINRASEDTTQKSKYITFVCNTLRAGYNFKLTEYDNLAIRRHATPLGDVFIWAKHWSEIKLIDPNIYNEELKGRDHTSITELTQLENDLKLLPDWPPAFSVTAARLRLFNSDHKPNITNDEWQILKNYLEKMDVNSNPISFLEGACGLKILAAHKAGVTRPGQIDIQMYPPEDMNTPTPPLPEKRKF